MELRPFSSEGNRCQGHLFSTNQKDTYNKMHRMSEVGTYEYTPEEQKGLRQHVDDPVNLYGGHGFKSANLETPVYTVPKAKAARLRANLKKGTQGFTPGYSLSDPMYMEYPDKHFFLEPAKPAAFGDAAPHNMVRSDCDTSTSFGVSLGGSNGNVNGNSLLGVPPHSGLVRAGASCSQPLGTSDPYARKTPSTHFESSRGPVLAVEAPMSLPSPNLAFGAESTQATNWLGYGCNSQPLKSFGADAPQMTVQGDFHPFDVPMKAVVPVKSPHLKTGTYMGATLEVPEAAYTAIPYQRTPTVMGAMGWPVNAISAMNSPIVRY